MDWTPILVLLTILLASILAVLLLAPHGLRAMLPGPVGDVRPLPANTVPERPTLPPRPSSPRTPRGASPTAGDARTPPPPPTFSAEDARHTPPPLLVIHPGARTARLGLTATLSDSDLAKHLINTAARLTITPTHASSIDGLRALRASLSTSDARLLAQEPIDVLIPNLTVRRALMSHSWLQPNPDGSTSPRTLLGARPQPYSVAEFLADLTLLTRDSLPILNARISSACIAVRQSRASDGSRDRATLALASIIDNACDDFTPAELADISLYSTIDTALADITLRSAVSRALASSPPPADASEVDQHLFKLTALLARMREQALHATAAATAARAYDSTPRPAATPIAAIHAEEAITVAAITTPRRFSASPNHPSTPCNLPDTCHSRYQADDAGNPRCLRGGHGPATPEGAQRAKEHGARQHPKRLLTATSAALAILCALPRAEASPPDLWVGVVAAVTGANPHTLVTSHVSVGQHVLLALNDPGATLSAIATTSVARLVTDGTASATGEMRPITVVGGALINCPTFTFPIVGSHNGTTYRRVITAAAVPALLHGSPIELILASPADHTLTVARFWTTPAPGMTDSEVVTDAGVIAAISSPAAPAPTPIHAREITASDLSRVAPDQTAWPAWVSVALLAILNCNRAIFSPLDRFGAPLAIPPLRVETTSSRPYDASFGNVWDRFSASQYNSFMGRVHDLVASGTYGWVDAQGYTLTTLPGSLGPGPRAPFDPSAPPPPLPWVHSAVLVPKGVDGARPALDLRPLNLRTVPTSQRGMPDVDTVLNALAGASIYSSFDARDYHYQIPVHPDDWHKTCFSTPLGLLQLRVVGQGWVNASIVAQQAMDHIYGPLMQPTAAHSTAPYSATVTSLPPSQPTGHSTVTVYQDDGAIATAINITTPPAIGTSAPHTVTAPAASAPAPTCTPVATHAPDVTPTGRHVSTSAPIITPDTVSSDAHAVVPQANGEAVRMPGAVAEGAPTLEDEGVPALLAVSTAVRDASSSWRALAPTSPTQHDLAFISHLHDLALALQLALGSNLRLSFEKLWLLQPYLDHLGERISREGRSIDPSRLEAIAALPTPASYTQAASGIAFFGHHRRYVLRFAELSRQFTDNPAFRSALTDPTRADRSTRPFTLSDQQLAAWQSLKAALLARLILAPLDHNHPIVIASDVCKYGAGGYILVGPFLKAFAYWSTTLTEAQLKYSVPDLECLAGVLLIKRFLRWLQSAPAIIWLCDHANMAHFALARGKKDIASLRISRWFDLLFDVMQLNLFIVTIKGSENVVPNALSRLPNPAPPQEIITYTTRELVASSPPPELLAIAVRAAQLRPAPREAPAVVASVDNAPSATPSTAAPTHRRSPRVASSPAATPTVTPAVTRAATPTHRRSPRVASAPAATPTASEPTPTAAPAATPAATPSATPTASAPSSTVTPAVAPAATPTHRRSPRVASAPAATPTTSAPSPTSTPVATPAPTNMPTASASHHRTVRFAPSPASAPALAPSSTVTPTVAPTTSAPSPTVTPVVAPAATPTDGGAATRPTNTSAATDTAPVVTPTASASHHRTVRFAPSPASVVAPALAPSSTVTPTVAPTATPAYRRSSRVASAPAAAPTTSAPSPTVTPTSTPVATPAPTNTSAATDTAPVVMPTASASHHRTVRFAPSPASVVTPAEAPADAGTAGAHRRANRHAWRLQHRLAHPPGASRPHARVAIVHRRPRPPGTAQGPHRGARHLDACRGLHLLLATRPHHRHPARRPMGTRGLHGHQTHAPRGGARGPGLHWIRRHPACALPGPRFLDGTPRRRQGLGSLVASPPAR